jgi:hypothetical protein
LRRIEQRDWQRSPVIGASPAIPIVIRFIAIPMTHADEIHHVTPDLIVWQAYEPDVKCDLTSAALRIGSSLLLIDPIRLSAEALEELLR